MKGLIFEMFGNFLNLIESDEKENDKLIDSIFDNTYDAMFEGIDSCDPYLSESAGFLLSNLTILNHS